MGGLFDISGAVKGLIGLGSEFIEDKDKRNEFNMRVKELESNLAVTLIEQKTHPKIDAAVKLLFAFKELWRPAVSASMFVLGAYLAVYKPEVFAALDKEIKVLLFGSFPAWGVSRHFKK